MSDLEPAEVARIRASLEMSRSELAAVLSLRSSDTIKKWEAGDSPCRGPAAVLLRLLSINPRLMETLAQLEALPNPDALPGDRDWFRLQRLLWRIGTHGGDSWWSRVFVEEHLTDAWVRRMKEKHYLAQKRGSRTVTCTHAAWDAFDVSRYERWRESPDRYGCDDGGVWDGSDFTPKPPPRLNYRAEDGNERALQEG